MITTKAGKWVEALVDCSGAQGLYIYALPPHLSIAVGDILSVPFGKQQIGAIAVRLLDEIPHTLSDSQIRAVDSVVSQGFFSAKYWYLLEKVAAYYQTPLMQVVRTALPPGLLGRSQRRVRLLPNVIPPDAEVFLPPAALCVLAQLQHSAEGDYTWQYLRQKCRGASRGIQALLQRQWAESYLALPKPPRPKRRQAVTIAHVPSPGEHALTTRQREVLSLLQRQGGDMWLQEALQYCRTTSTTMRSLAKKGYLSIEEREVLRQPATYTATSDTPKALTAAQQTALETIQSLTSYAVCLLHGVTGSGKTEVYLQAIAPRLQSGQSALVLVPEIGLTPQLTDRFQQRFGDRVCVYHSGLSDGERYDAWRRMLQGEPLVAIGTRSAVFAPLPNLGIIILDEEHDGSFKQDQPMPCYHARTVAEWRAESETCPLVLGSATPSLESWVALQGSTSEAAQPVSEKMDLGEVKRDRTPTLHYLSLPERVHKRPLPPITVVDMRLELQIGNRSIFSRTLRSALEDMKAQGEQGILFIQRRGHSSFVSCRACGHVMMCPHCDVSLSYHRIHSQATSLLRCHYCGFSQIQPPDCPACGSKYLKHFGSGTQRVEQALETELPELRCLRFDSDTTRNKGAHRALLSRFANGEADVLVGTQMLTKGIDLPQVTVVGIIAADGLLYMADYRASERAFQVLTQVAGRSGRGEQPGRVILQTYNPENPVVQAVKQQDMLGFLDTEIEQRSTLTYPPIGRLILLRVTSPNPQLAEETAHDIAAHVAPRLSDDWSLLGPAPAPVLRVARRYRWHVLLRGVISAPIPDLTDLPKQCPNQVSLTIDVDPLNLM
ncbi:primosomal protein N' [Oscillatoria sp. CS-180]|uniref:primosomal protein N' n=1 Tax=Oscillatoria sp. CS-180 TaxID=3021720 RepID=UPI00232F2712|nr:primosomal protein N' [Oscillatoria sp. CS-180]MDB9527647.1 primosomal protein N' [Oscillatoria sp. CS-180]